MIFKKPGGTLVPPGFLTQSEGFLQMNFRIHNWFAIYTVNLEA
jgi:hypothetical protein